jgi:hypothetical protein
MIPQITIARWGGRGEDGRHDYTGRSIAIEWFGLILELNFGRARP